ncbi:MAG: TonB C-terminal domain-containing protein [bacterium]|nr:TonB C-terminal domain-containing protein [bacterium]
MEQRRQTKVIILSLLLHILFLLVWQGLKVLDIDWFSIKPEVVKAEEPIVFEFQQPRKPTQVIETPDDAKVVEKQKNAKYLSDKNAVARNRETDPKLKVDEAFSRGDFKSHDLPVQKAPIGQQPQPKVPEQQEKSREEKERGDSEEKPKANPEDLLIENSGTSFYREYVLKKPNPLTPGIREQLPGVRHDNRTSVAEDVGGLSFNTYNWEFAPYLLMLKQRIQRNIFPPAAFTRLGLISGESLIRFKIYPNGELRDLEILDYAGHKSLMETSHKAIQISAPFPQLPADFPEEYLEVTGKFMYIVRR